MENGCENDEAEQEDAESAENECDDHFPSSKWDKSTESFVLSPSSKNIDNESSLLYLICEILTGTIISLWPESKSMTIPRFLFERGFFEALRVKYSYSPKYSYTIHIFVLALLRVK